MVFGLHFNKKKQKRLLLFRDDYCYVLTAMLSIDYFDSRTHMEGATVRFRVVCGHISSHVVLMFHLSSKIDNMTSI